MRLHDWWQRRRDGSVAEWTGRAGLALFDYYWVRSALNSSRNINQTFLFFFLSFSFSPHSCVWCLLSIFFYSQFPASPLSAHSMCLLCNQKVLCTFCSHPALPKCFFWFFCKDGCTLACLSSLKLKRCCSTTPSFIPRASMLFPFTQQWLFWEKNTEFQARWSCSLPLAARAHCAEDFLGRKGVIFISSLYV